MQVADFEAAPTRDRHPAYENSFLYTTAPEWSTGEVLVAAACRSLLLGIGESSVDLENITRTPLSMPLSTGGPETWTRLLTERGGIASPLKHHQYSPTASRQLMPIVPSIARLGGVLGKRPRSRWNPSNLLFETIGAGMGAPGRELLFHLGEALEVTVADDVFARFLEESLQKGLEAVHPLPLPAAPFRALKLEDGRLRAHRRPVTSARPSPAERFCCDLPSVLATKGSLSRRQWTVLLESILRLGLGMHALWTCNANAVAWETTLSVASGESPPTAAKVATATWEINEDTQPLLELGANATPLIARIIERYAYARTGLNLLLCALDDAGWPVTRPVGFSTQGGLDAPTALAEFYQHVHAHRHAIDPGDAGQWLRRRVRDLFDRQEDLRDLAKSASGYTKNLLEFTRHTLGQVKSQDADQRSYDLSYLLAYAGERRGGPLPVQPGPAMLLMLVHACCAAGQAIPVSLDDFRKHLMGYGLHVPAGELVHGKTGADLAMLGLVVDSPDAAGGRLLVKPF